MEPISIISTKATSKLPSQSLTSVTIPTPPVSPPLDSPRTISELISLRARQLPNESILGYPTEDNQYGEYTYSQLQSFRTRAASIYGQELLVRSSSSAAERVVAVLGASTLDYFITSLALSQLGFTVLFLSTRISEAAYISLLNDTKCRSMVVDSSFQRTASLLQSTISDLQIISIQDFAQYSSVPCHDTTTLSLPVFDLDEETHKTCWIIHSSGSTGLPKPIYQTHEAALRNYENNMNMRGFITLPLFHAHGLSSVFRAISSVKTIYMYNASLPLTRQSLLDIMKNNPYGLEIFYGVPYALKLLSETKDGIEALAAMKAVMFGGSACPDVLGDLLVDGGVNLISHYGTTETGQLMTSFRPDGDKAWNYVRVHEQLQPYVRWEHRGANLYELIVLAGWPSKVATNRPDGAYATKDLFEPHSEISNAWKYSGRLDDTIVLMNGEKAIPTAIEQAVRQNKLVREAVIFGTGKSRLGMIVIASESALHMPAQELLEAIWPTVEKENNKSPAYAQLSADMVSVLAAGTAYPQTDKGTVIRQAFYRKFQHEIEEVYQLLETTTSGTLVLSPKEMREFLRKEISNLVTQEDASHLVDSTDLFSLGIDSLQSTRLRGTLVQQLQFNGHGVPQNVVFENPTISRLADELVRIRDGTGGEANKRDVIKEMEGLVSKYGVFPAHVPRPPAANTCVVVTGATGSLGAHVVAQLVCREDVSEVCCLVRSSSDGSAHSRVIHSMRERALYHSLSLSQRRKIHCLKSNLLNEKLGLSDERYGDLSRKITTLVHCAWSVNFNKSLSSMEDCIAGAHHLMLLCLSAQRPQPASFNFCSSVSTVARTPSATVEESLPESFNCAQGMGYAQSKLVTETLVVKAAEFMPARVLRVGQIIADTVHGIWNDTEAIPLMLQAATTIKALPALDEQQRWLPVDTVATTVLDISLSSTPQTVFNVVNPKTFHWTRDLIPCLRSAGLSFEEVDQREWIRRLRASNPNPEENPTIKLVEFFATKYDNNNFKRKSLGYNTTASESLSPALASTPQLSQALVTKFIKQFLRTSWAASSTLPASPSTPRTRLIIVSGPCGSGKSTVATALAHRLGCATGVLEGDAVHDSIAITKMSSGIPLAALDRQIWLTRLKTQVLERVRAALLVRRASVGNKAEANGETTIILTCSALKREHRDVLRDMLSDGSIRTEFLALQVSEGELFKRVGARTGHYMKEGMVASQIASVEEPMFDEVDILPVDAECSSVEDIVAEAADCLGA